MAAVTEVRIVTGLRAASQCIAWICAKTGAVAKHGLTATGLRWGPESAAGLLQSGPDRQT
jgi:hypothetical protein